MRVGESLWPICKQLETSCLWVSGVCREPSPQPQLGSFMGPVYYEDIQEKGKVLSLVNCFSMWTVTSKKSEVSPVTQPPLEVSRHLCLLPE